MADFTFATLRLGKTSVEEIKRIKVALQLNRSLSQLCVPRFLQIWMLVSLFLFGSVLITARVWQPSGSKALKQSVESPLSPEAKSTTMKALLK